MAYLKALSCHSPERTEPPSQCPGLQQSASRISYCLSQRARSLICNCRRYSTTRRTLGIMLHIIHSVKLNIKDAVDGRCSNPACQLLAEQMVRLEATMIGAMLTLNLHAYVIRPPDNFPS